jgi:hypothetical protein
MSQKYLINDSTGVRSRPFDALGSKQSYATFLAYVLEHN